MWAKLINNLQNLFEINHREAKGISYLLMICIIVLFTPLIFKALYPTNPAYEINSSTADSILLLITKPIQTKEKSAQIVRKAPEKPTKIRPQRPKKVEKKKKFRININNADTTELMAVYGIGPVLSNRIVKYRDLLGGFYSVEQLSEVWGLKDYALQNILEVADIDTLAINPSIDLQTDSFKELLSHPYLDYDDVLRLVKFRDSLAVIKPTDLLEGKLIDSSKFRKLKPYLVR